MLFNKHSSPNPLVKWMSITNDIFATNTSMKVDVELGLERNHYQMSKESKSILRLLHNFPKHL